MKKQEQTFNDMKPLNCLIVCLTTLAFTPAFGQQPVGSVTPMPGVPVEAPKPTTTKFNLDFPGGTPKQLITAIEKTIGKTLNVIIPSEFAETMLPPLKMNNVNLSQLFNALWRSSSLHKATKAKYGFITAGEPCDESIWLFVYDSEYNKVCRYYSLAPYLERGMTVDDITTAIQTGWKMLGDKEMPTINFHKDTKLLIAVGEPNKLQTIEAVLNALATGLEKRQVIPACGHAPTPKSTEKSKTEN